MGARRLYTYPQSHNNSRIININIRLLDSIHFFCGFVVVRCVLPYMDSIPTTAKMHSSGSLTKPFVQFAIRNFCMMEIDTKQQKISTTRSTRSRSITLSESPPLTHLHL